MDVQRKRFAIVGISDLYNKNKVSDTIPQLAELENSQYLSQLDEDGHH
jgi:hypothetical protein